MPCPAKPPKKKEHIFSNLQQSSAIFSSGGGGDGKKVVGEGRGEEGVKLLFLLFFHWWSVLSEQRDAFTDVPVNIEHHLQHPRDMETMASSKENPSSTRMTRQRRRRENILTESEKQLWTLSPGYR